MRSLAWILLLVALAGPAAAQTERVISVRGGPRLHIVVPAGYSFESATNHDGSVRIKMENPVWKIIIEGLIGPESARTSASPEWQQNKLITFISRALPDAKETDYNFKPLQPLSGTGIVCVFTALDAEPGAEPEPGSFFYLTGGLKAQARSVVIFQVLSNETKSLEYREAVDVFVTSFSEL